jgi:hypothetical protein
MRSSGLNSAIHTMLAFLKQATGIILLGFAFSACQKVIEIDLKETNRVIVIEAEVSDQDRPHSVKLSRVINYNEPNFFPQVRGAIVTLSDDAGNSVMLSEETPGLYLTGAIAGVPGRTYTLTVQTGGREYKAISTMPLPVAIDSLVQREVRFGPVATKAVRVHFQDPDTPGNFYRLVQQTQQKRDRSIYIAEDRLRNGLSFNPTLLNRDDSFSLRKGDTLTVELQSIDNNVYEYLRTLSETLSNGGPNSASPANPVTNLGNGAMGFFSAHAVNAQQIVIQ